MFAREMGVNVATVRKSIQRGQLRGRNFSGSIYVRRIDFETLWTEGAKHSTSLEDLPLFKEDGDCVGDPPS